MRCPKPLDQSPIWTGFEELQPLSIQVEGASHDSIYDGRICRDCGEPETGLKQGPAKGAKRLQCGRVLRGYEALKGHQSSHEIANCGDLSTLPVMILRRAQVLVANIVKVFEQNKKVGVLAPWHG
jgi:hypothetical protein